MSLEDELLKQRWERIREIESLGFHAYGRKYDFTHTVPQILNEYSAKTAEELSPDFKVRVSGRVKTFRSKGKAGFAHLQQHLHAGEVHSPLLREVADDPYPLEILVGVKPDVRVGPYRLDQTLLLIDPQRARMAAGDARRDRDHVNGPTSTRHRDVYNTYQRHCQGSCGTRAEPPALGPSRRALS